MNTINQALLARLKLNRAALLDDKGRVTIDLACRSCGYNLRGAAGDGGCPECGRPVQDALKDDRPEHSNPAWLNKVALGGNLFGIAALAAVALLLLIIGTAFLFDTTRHRALIQLFLYANLLLALATAGVALTAVWLITLRDKTRHHIRRETYYRWAARIGLTAFAPVGFLMIQLTARTGLIYGNSNLRAALGLASVTLPTVLLTCGLIALMLYLQTLATRMTDWNLVQSITTVCYGLGLCAAGIILSFLLAIPFGEPVLFCGCCSTLVAGALVLWMLLLIECIRQNLNAAKQRAKWNREAQ